MFEVAEAYESMMGRWSRQLAPLFVEFVGVQEGEKVLDAGCGTGSLSETLARVTGASKIVGIDPSKGFVEYARTNVTDPRVTFELGDAQALSYADESFDRCMALLIVNFIPDAPKATKEMRRVTKSGGVVATTMWDGSGANELNASLWEAAISIDPTAKRIADRRGYYGSAAALSDLWKGAGLTDIEVAPLPMRCQFSSFDDYWLPLTKGARAFWSLSERTLGRSPSCVARATAAESSRQPCRRAVYTSGESVGSSWGRTLNIGLSMDRLLPSQTAMSYPVKLT